MTRPDSSPPAFSILIGRVSTEDGDRILETLQALREQEGGLAHEIVVVDRLDDVVSQAIRTRYPEVKLLRCDRTATLPEMRAQALAASTAAWILVTEDHCVPPRTWLRDFRAALDAHPDASVIAGCVENGVTERVLDWATFLCEYAAFAPPVAEGRGTALAGMNVCYQRSALEDGDPQRLTRGFWETTVHPALEREGRTLISTNAVRMYHCKRFSFGLFAAQRFAYSRYYAGIRFPREKLAVRWAAALATPILPALLTWRLVRAARRKASIAAPALRAVPYLLAFFAVWAAGEAVGYLAGPGEALRSIE